MLCWSSYGRPVLGVHTNSSNLAGHGETGCFPLLIKKKVNSLKYWSRIISMPEQSPVKLMCTNLLGLINGGFKAQLTNIENMTIEAGLTTVWEDQVCSVADIHHFRSRQMEKL